MVIRLMFILIKLRFARKVVFIFLIRGHTKNDCDRMFNLMKINYRKSNVYTPDQLYEHIQSNENVVCIPVDPTRDFKDFCAFEDKYLQALPKILDKHIFTCVAAAPNKLTLQHANGEEKTVHFGVKRAFHDRDVDWCGDIETKLVSIVPVGLQDIKWVELHDKWKPLVPHQHRNDFKYYRKDPGTERRAKVKAHSKKSKQQRQERSRTAED
jgi:hypothetical protein